MKRIILAAALALPATSAIAQVSIGDAVLSAVISEAVTGTTPDAWVPPVTYRRLDVPNYVGSGPIMYPIPGIPTHPQPYTPDPPFGSGEPYQLRW